MFNGDYVNQARGSSNFSTNVLMGAMSTWGKFKGFSINPELATLTPDDILTSADLAWSPMIAESGYFDPINQTWRGLGESGADQYALIRADTGQYVSTIGRVMASAIRQGGCSYLESLTDLIGAYVNAGSVPMRVVSYDNGASVVVQIAITDGVAADRPYVNWLNLRDGLDGKTKRSYHVGNTCILCPNTYAAVKGEALESDNSAKHTPNSLASWRHAVEVSQRETIGVWQNFRQTMENLALTPIRINDVNNLAEALFGAQERQAGKRGRLVEAVLTSAADVNRAGLTAEDLFAGVTRYVGQSTANRSENDQFAYVNGEGQKMVNRTIDILNAQYSGVMSGMMA